MQFMLRTIHKPLSRPLSLCRYARTTSAWLSTKTDGKEEPFHVGIFKNPIVHQLWTARQEAKERAKSSPRSADAPEGQGKTSSESQVEVTYPFSTDPMLLETYRNPWGQIRLGKMLEDLDALAGNIAYFHAHEDNKEDPLIVTASVDRIRLRQRPSGNCDQHLSGCVTWTGSSSMEIRMQCRDEGCIDEDWLEAYVTFVTLDPKTHRPVKIPTLLPQSAEERALFDAGSARAALRKSRRHADKGPNPQVDKLATELLEAAAPLIRMPSLASPNTILMRDTELQNALVAQPQVRNLHQRIFGGYLMRVAFELAYANAYLFGGGRPRFMEVDHVSFTKPVDVGDLLVFNSRVLYTQSMEGYATVHLQVVAWVTEPEAVSASVANQFYFTFRIEDKDVPKVFPANLDEAKLAATRILADREQSRG